MTATPLLRFVARRVLAAVLIVVAVSAVTFSFIHLAPGGPEQTLAGRFATPEQLEAIRAQYGLDDPLPAQYARYLGDAARLDFGDSLATREPVADAIGSRAGVTAPLVLISFLLIWLIGTALGALAAHRRGSVTDRAVGGVAIAGASTPVFASGVLLIYVFGVELGWLPASGDGSAEHLVLPIVALTISGVAAMLKITRARVAEVLDEDYVTFARSRGLSRPYISRVVLRNAGVQILTQSGAILLALVAAGIVVEATFDLNGLGTLFVKAVEQRDIPLVQALSLLITVFIVAVNLLVDLLYFALDPRVRVRMVTA